jgi:hypothetical protein
MQHDEAHGALNLYAELEQAIAQGADLSLWGYATAWIWGELRLLLGNVNTFQKHMVSDLAT